MATTRQTTAAGFNNVTNENIEEMANIINEKKYVQVSLYSPYEFLNFKQFFSVLSKEKTVLEKLELRCCKFDEDSATGLAEIIRNMPLKELGLIDCRYNATVFDIIMDAINEKASIETFNLLYQRDLFTEHEYDEKSGDTISKTNIKAYESLKKLLLNPKSKLRVLNMPGSQVDDTGAKIIFDALIENKNSVLQELDLHQARISGKSVEKALRANIPLMRLNIKRCWLEKGDIAAISAAMEFNTNMLVLRIDSDFLQEEAANIAAFLEKNKTLKELDLGFDEHFSKLLSLTDDGVDLLCKAIKANPNSALKRLDLSGNKIGEKGAIQLAELKNLESLSLRKCLVTDLGAIALVNSHIKRLDLSCNKLTQNAIKAFEQAPVCNQLTIAEQWRVEKGKVKGKLTLDVKALEEKMAKEKATQAHWKKAAVGIASVRATASNPLRHHIISLFSDIKKADEEVPKMDIYDMSTFKKPAPPAMDKKG